MKKLLACLLIIAMIFSFAACGAEAEEETTAEAQTTESAAEEETKKESNGAVDVVAIKDEFIKKFELTDAIEMNEALLLNQYGIAEDAMVAHGCFIVQTGLFPAEIIMVEAVDEAAAKDITEKLNTRLESLMAQSKSYDPESYELAQACHVITEGNYVAMFFSEDGAEMEEIYNSYF